MEHGTQAGADTVVAAETGAESSADPASAQTPHTAPDEHGERVEPDFADPSDEALSSARAGLLSMARGKIDRIDTDGVAGWAFDVAKAGESLMVELWDGHQALLRVCANIARSDVNKSFEITGAHGYQISFPESLYDGHAHAIRVLVNGREASRTKAVPQSITLTRADLQRIAPAARYEGRVEGLSNSQVHGWAFDRKNPDRPVSLSVFVDDECVGLISANRFAARVRSDQRDGHQIFLFKFPLRLMNGQPRNIRVHVTGTDFQLNGSAAPVLFPLVDHFGQLPAAAEARDFAYAPPARVWRSAAPQRGSDAPDRADTDTAAPLLSLIVLNWNGASLLQQFLESLQRVRWRHSFEVILVDHGSTDESLALARAAADTLDLRIIERGANHSFSASNNLAAGLARGRYLALANNDLVMLHDCFSVMLPHLDDPTVGGVGLKLLEPLKTGPGRWGYITHHQGVEFDTSGKLPGTDIRYYTPMEIGERSEAELAAAYHLPASTGALFICRATDFRQLGGFHEGYVYGMEDVDLCLGLQLKLGKKVITDTSAVALHNRSATREAKLPAPERGRRQTTQQHLANRKLFIRRFGRHLPRTVLASLVRGETFWRSTPLRVVFVVTEAHLSTAAGDFFTAVELAESLRRLHGWEVMFATMRTYALSGADVAVVMCYDYQVQKISDANPGLVTVAWVRNRVDQWVASPYFGAYQLIFCSSRKGMAYIAERTGRSATLLPIATNARRFSPKPPVANQASDLAFTGSNWSSPRDAVTWLDAEAIDFAIYGHRWDQVPEWRPHWRGAVPYTQLPEIYSSAKIVLDDSHPVTRDWNSLNSRVFDALGCGKLVLTNCVGGGDELFGGELPTFSDGEALRQLVLYYLAQPQEREALAQKLHREVLEHHTYDHRARLFKEVLGEFAERALRFAIKIGVPSRAECESWGDYHFALALQRALRRRGHFVRIDLLPDWNSGLGAGDDVVIVLRGLSAYQPQPTAINLMWLISHPDEVSLAECQGYDHVFVASEPYAQRLAARLGDKVSTLLQCTDPALFHPVSDAEPSAGVAAPADSDPLPDIGEVIFVGNSRGQRRDAVQFALDAGVDVAVYGALWEGLLPPSRLRASHVPNRVLQRYYAGAKVVLNDHWPDMRSEGFVSNRLFDAGACGATILSDDMPACRALFGDAVAYFDSPASLAEGVRTLLHDEAGRRARGAQLAALIRAHHSFDHRVDAILATVAALSVPG
ncbi:glycosyltransferase family protein [Aquabacterium sp.]|uniref:glycosyltransferase family protein n=1 Tax=Aquabacterium sp. TaxID=1872578 RepID=UPI002BC4B666|nr:glycosyltransferase [Aquabacterium sp.]HSW07425.1 glycosyltransferase [Aquabacterium sp.]